MVSYVYRNRFSRNFWKQTDKKHRPTYEQHTDLPIKTSIKGAPWNFILSILPPTDSQISNSQYDDALSRIKKPKNSVSYPPLYTGFGKCLLANENIFWEISHICYVLSRWQVGLKLISNLRIVQGFSFMFNFPH